MYAKARRTSITDSKRELLSKYRDLRRNLKKRLIYTQQQYLHNELLLSKDYKKTWRILYREGLTATKQSLATSFFNLDELNNYYCSISSSHPPCSKIDLESIINNTPIETDHEFNFTPITPTQIFDTAKHLITKSQGRSPDDLPLKHLLPYLD